MIYCCYYNYIQNHVIPTPQSLVLRQVLNSVLASIEQRPELQLPRGQGLFPSFGLQIGQNCAFESIGQGSGKDNQCQHRYNQ